MSKTIGKILHSINGKIYLLKCGNCGHVIKPNKASNYKPKKCTKCQYQFERYVKR